MDSAELAARLPGLAAGDPQDLAVLARTHFLLDKLSEELKANQIPHTKIGKTHRLMNTIEFRKFHAFLKLLINPYDNFSLLLIRESLGISRETYNMIRLEATQQSKSHFQVWMVSAGSDPHGIFFHEYLAGDWNLIKTIATLGSQYTRTHDSIQFAMDWIEENPNGTLPQYLDYVALYDIQDEIQETDKDLKLMTVHAAKGLEWPMVIIAGVNEGLLPSKQAIDNDEIEQERRLMYVAMTRAKDFLVLTVRPERKENEYGRVFENPKSRFLTEALLNEE
jgi:DNA helicase-2/ATP-dependent DNA helicase PcrA